MGELLRGVLDYDTCLLAFLRLLSLEIGLALIISISTGIEAWVETVALGPAHMELINLSLMQSARRIPH